MGQAKKQLQMLHNDTKGYISICRKSGSEWRQKGYQFKDALQALQELIGTENVYASQNSFRSPLRRNRNVLEFRSCYCDLDYYSLSNLFTQTPEQILLWLEAEYFSYKMPSPNYVLFSGRGLSIVWTINPEPPERLPEWSLVQQYIFGQLEEMGADSKAIDPARVFRLAETVNSKNGSMTHLKIYSHAKYDLDELLEYVPEVKPKKQLDKPLNRPRIVRNNKHISTILSERSLLYARLQDLATLQAIRNEQGVKSGHREFMCFLCRYWSTCFTTSPEQSLQDTLDFNADFLMPLSEQEVITATASAEKAFKKKMDNIRNGSFAWTGYNYKNITLIRQLNISPEEQTKLKTIIGKQERNRRDKERKKLERRNENGLTKREQEKQDRERKILELHKRGLKQKEIAATLEISISTIKRCLRNSKGSRNVCLY